MRLCNLSSETISQTVEILKAPPDITLHYIILFPNLGFHVGKTVVKKSKTSYRPCDIIVTPIVISLPLQHTVHLEVTVQQRPR